MVIFFSFVCVFDSLKKIEGQKVSDADIWLMCSQRIDKPAKNTNTKRVNEIEGSKVVPGVVGRRREQREVINEALGSK